MSPEQAKELLTVLAAYAERVAIQFRLHEESDNWRDWSYEHKGHPDFDGFKWRVRPEKKWRSWTWDECPQNFIAQNKKTPAVVRVSIKQMGYDHVRFYDRETVSPERISFDELLSDWDRVNEDGSLSPCGVES